MEVVGERQLTVQAEKGTRRVLYWPVLEKTDSIRRRERPRQLPRNPTK